MRYALSLLALVLALVAPAAHADPSGPPAASEEVGTEKVVISSGHVDLGLRQLDGRWELMARDDTVSPPVWRHTDDVVMHVSDSALTEVPDDETYSFLGVERGAKAHVIPQTENPATVWLGWNTQAPETIETFPRGAELELVDHRGDGDLHLFIANGFDAPLKLWNSTEGPGQTVHMEPNTHVHANWIFTAPGGHTVDVAAHGVAADGSTVTASASLHFAVGAAPDPLATPADEPAASATPHESAVTATPHESAVASTPAGEGAPAAPTSEEAVPGATTAVPERAPATKEPGTTKGPGSVQTGSPLVWAGAGAGIVAVVVGALWLRSRAAKRRGEAWRDDA